MLTQARLKEILEYDPETGLFRWIDSYHKWEKDWFAGAPMAGGYLQLRVDGVLHYAHRLAWLYVHGEFVKFLDHENRNKAQNQIKNLRPATKSDNTCNSVMRSDNSSGHRGVYYWAARQKYQAYVTKDGKKVSKLFATYEEAVAWREQQAIELHGEFKYQESSGQTLNDLPSPVRPRKRTRLLVSVSPRPEDNAEEVCPVPGPV